MMYTYIVRTLHLTQRSDEGSALSEAISTHKGNIQQSHAHCFGK